MSLIPHDLAEPLDTILAAKYEKVVYGEVNGVPYVGVPIEALIGPALDDAFDGVEEWYPPAG